MKGRIMTPPEVLEQETRTPEQIVVEYIARLLSASDGGNGWHIIIKPSTDLRQDHKSRLRLTAEVAVALAQHPDAAEKEAFYAEKIVASWFEDAHFIRTMTAEIKRAKSIWPALDALGKAHASKTYRVACDCHRRTVAADAVIEYWDKQRRIQNLLAV